MAKGTVYRRPGCATYTIDFYAGTPARRYRKQTKLKTHAEAMQRLRRLMTQADDGIFDPEVEKRNALVPELLDAVRADYRKKGRRTVSHVETRWKLHLEPFFAMYPARNVTGNTLNEYVDSRLKQGASNATVNRELALLKRMFVLGRKADPPLVHKVPPFPKLDERDAVRQGFLTVEQWDAILQQNPPLWLRALLTTYFRLGMRKSEVLGLKVQQVDLRAGLIRLEGPSTKNRTGRSAPITADLRPLLEILCAGKPGDAPVYTREDGTPVRDFRKAFHLVMVEAGLAQLICRKCNVAVTSDKCACGSLRSEAKYVGLILHDCRRSAARNLRYTGVPETTIQAIGGWKTRSVFQRYAIVDAGDVLQAGRMLDAAEERRKAQQAADGHKDGLKTDADAADAKPGKPN